MAQHPSTKKSLGQHLLKDGNMIRKIVESIPASEDEYVIEIGPGAGALTELLAEKYDDVTAIEIDQRMVQHLQDQFPDISIVQGDILKLNWDEMLTGKKSVHIVGNLPYYITSQILFALLEQRHKLKSAVLMMQKEVAERIVAVPRTKEYGILSVQTQLMATPEILFDVPPQVFSPPPNVNSAVIRLIFNKPKLACSDKHLKTVVRMAFNQRRKKLSNALKRLNVELPEDEFDLNLRAEALTPSEFEKLTVRYEELIGS